MIPEAAMRTLLQGGKVPFGTESVIGKAEETKWIRGLLPGRVGKGGNRVKAGKSTCCVLFAMGVPLPGKYTGSSLCFGIKVIWNFKGHGKPTKIPNFRRFMAKV